MGMGVNVTAQVPFCAESRRDARPRQGVWTAQSILHRIQTPPLGGGHGESEPRSVGALE